MKNFKMVDMAASRISERNEFSNYEYPCYFNASYHVPVNPTSDLSNLRH